MRRIQRISSNAGQTGAAIVRVRMKFWSAQLRKLAGNRFLTRQRDGISAMTSPFENSGSFSRRDLVGSAISAAALAAAFGGPISIAAATEPAQAPPGKQYPFKKSINQRAFPHPQKMTLEQCLRLAQDAGV